MTSAFQVPASRGNRAAALIEAARSAAIKDAFGDSPGDSFPSYLFLFFFFFSFTLAKRNLHSDARRKLRNRRATGTASCANFRLVRTNFRMHNETGRQRK